MTSLKMDLLRTAFGARFSGDPELLSRAPGRVNLIGEHTDYNDLPVFPMALQREVRIALTPRPDGLVRLFNVSPEFDLVQFSIGAAIEKSAAGDWGNYVKAPANELANRFAISKGFDGVLVSDVPVASGLSSSSALVNAVGLALSHINEISVDSLKLADVMADAERYTGTRGGGMDQAISMAARGGHAARIDFSPLRMHHVMMPPDWCLVVADTGVRAEKSGGAQAAYNLRRSECEQALEVVGTELVKRDADLTLPQRYPDLLKLVGFEGALEIGAAVLQGNLLRRYRHVITEALRVEKAQEAVVAADIMAFGDLMDASHGSLRSDYHVSSAELDELVALAKEGGAAGARLTGAGFGGCIVALTERSTVSGVLDVLTSAYYEPRHMTSGLSDRVFIAVPSAGASVEDFPRE
jgi:galactokinase